MKSLVKLSLVAVLTLYVSGYPNPEPTAEASDMDCHQNAMQDNILVDEPVAHEVLPDIREFNPSPETAPIMFVPVEVATPRPEHRRPPTTQSILPLLENAKLDNQDPIFYDPGNDQRNMYEPSPLLKPQDTHALVEARHRGGHPGIVCYACTTLGNPHCQRPNASATAVKYCALGHQCVVKTYKQQGTMILVRDCGSCDCGTEQPLRPEQCRACSGDICNTATAAEVNGAALPPSAAALAALLASLVMYTSC